MLRKRLDKYLLFIRLKNEIISRQNKKNTLFLNHPVQMREKNRYTLPACQVLNC